MAIRQHRNKPKRVVVKKTTPRNNHKARKRTGGKRAKV